MVTREKLEEKAFLQKNEVTEKEEKNPKDKYRREESEREREECKTAFDQN